MISYRHERRLLQLAIFIAACVPIAAGALGMLIGIPLFDASANNALDNHFCYLSGLLCGLGLNFWIMIPHIERHGTTVRVLTSMVVLGGLARLGASFLVDGFSWSIIFTLVMELFITPLLCVWQARIVRLAR